MKKSKLKIILATGLAVFNLFMCFTGVVAWFCAAHVNDASQMSIQLYTHDLDMTYRVYRYDDDEKSPVDVTGRDDALVLPQYDSVIKSRNEHTPVIIEFAITGMALNENVPIHLNTLCTNETLSDRVLSNIVELKFGLQSFAEESTAATIYDTSVEYFKNIQANLFKTTIKETEILYTATNYSSYVVDGKLFLYMQLDYSETLIDGFEFSFSDDSTIFENDLTVINCYTEQ